MLTQGPAKKVTVYVGDGAQHRGEPLYLTVLNYLFQQRVSGATVTRGMAGFGAEHHMHTTRMLDMSQNLPVKIEFIESPEALDTLLPKLLELVDHGLIAVSDVEVIRSPQRPDPTQAP